MSEFWVPPRSSDLGNRLAEGEAGFCLNRCAASAPMPRPSVLGSGVRASPGPGVEPPAVVRTGAPLRLRGSGVRLRGGGRWRGVWVDCGLMRSAGGSPEGARSLERSQAPARPLLSPGAGWLPVATLRAPGGVLCGWEVPSGARCAGQGGPCPCE